MNKFQIQIGSELGILRAEKGMTQMQVAAHLSVSHTTLARTETGELLPTDPVLSELALFYGKDPNYFLPRAQSARQLNEIRTVVHKLLGLEHSKYPDLNVHDFPELKSFIESLESFLVSIYLGEIDQAAALKSLESMQNRLNNLELSKPVLANHAALQFMDCIARSRFLAQLNILKETEQGRDFLKQIISTS